MNTFYGLHFVEAVSKNLVRLDNKMKSSYFLFSQNRKKERNMIKTTLGLVPIFTKRIDEGNYLTYNDPVLSVWLSRDGLDI